ncbi:ABC transporter permease [Catalinimonas niigatensis]|uniref:ABC transporter permease n=1 Tax=Catalinimonas niigatensis TaxID=1397264 RepID=UPI002666A3C8|nr:ABC transporter permease [Catalinimonas niigatensis]WPP49778.1 FtsX-like permease family protein [Catalinimonas niigatensis]
MKHSPPKLFLRLFRWYCHPKLVDFIEGDLIEEYQERVRNSGKRKANRKFIIDILLLFRPGIIRPIELYKNLNTTDMYKSYFKLAWRQLFKQQGYSFINVSGLALGMTVALLIGLWVFDELSFNTYHQNYEDIAQVWGGGINPETQAVEGLFALQYPVGEILKDNYLQYFKHVTKVFSIDCTVSFEDKKFKRSGLFVQEEALEMLSLKMLKGSYQSLHDPYSIILSASTAKAIFGDEDPINQSLSIDNTVEVTVTGVYEDLPRNSSFNDTQLFLPWSLIPAYREWMKGKETDWDNRLVAIYVQLQPNTTMEAANAAIHDLYNENVPDDFFATIEKYRPFVQLIPMSTWHLYAEFENGKPTSGRITYVWLFSIVGAFVLLLACINFINLSTARSEKRAREVGVRKAIGSAKRQLIAQFLSESFLTVLLAFILSVLLLVLLQSPFNELADKDISLPFYNPIFWGMALAFILLTALLAGLYPAFYLSSFQPVKVLKGALRTGRTAALPRKVLVIVQFTVSIVLIMGTLIVYQQIQHARNRPIGYDRESLITLEMSDPNYQGKQEVIRTELLNTGVVSEVATSSSSLTDVGNVTGGYTWQGKDPNLDVSFVRSHISPDFGETVGWEVVAGRDFSRDFATDTTEAIIINQAAATIMGSQNPIGQTITDVDEFDSPKWTKTIIGVVQDIITASPYEPVSPAIYFYDEDASKLLHIKISPEVSAHTALPKIEATLEEIVPTALFDYTFVDEAYGQKFSQEERIGKLAGIFAGLAIFISCLGLYGLASYVAEQRTKEIGIRKVVGASVFHLWKMLSTDFVVLVVISCGVAIPIAYYFLTAWLQQYEYHTNISWWLWGITCLTALLITLLTVSYQTLKTATMNPVKSLRWE